MTEIEQESSLFLKHVGIQAFRMQGLPAFLKLVVPGLQRRERLLRLGNPQIHPFPGNQPVITLNGMMEKIADNHASKHRSKQAGDAKPPIPESHDTLRMFAE